MNKRRQPGLGVDQEGLDSSEDYTYLVVSPTQHPSYVKSAVVIDDYAFPASDYKRRSWRRTDI